MRIRRGRKVDMNRVMTFLRKMQPTSPYYRGIPVDPQGFRAAYQALCDQHNTGESHVGLIVDDKHQVHGVLLGAMINMFGLRANYATDIIFVVDKHARHLAAGLFRGFLTWAIEAANGNVIVASTHGLEPQRIAQFYESFGLTHLGPVYGARDLTEIPKQTIRQAS